MTPRGYPAASAALLELHRCPAIRSVAPEDWAWDRSAEFPWESTIYRIRLVDHPSAADIELVHRFAFDPSHDAPQATRLAFAKSGNLYVSLIGPSQISVLDPAGNEIRRISSPLFHSPRVLAFTGSHCS